MWDDYDIGSPLLSNRCTITSVIGEFSYETLTLPIPDTLHGVIIQIPDERSRERPGAAFA